MATKRRRVARRPLDVFDNPFATRDGDGVRRIHRNDGRWAKPTWSTRKGVRLRKAARANPSIYNNPSKDALGRVHKNDGRFAGGPLSKGGLAKRVRARHHAPIPWQAKMLAAKKAKAAARKRATARKPTTRKTTGRKTTARKTTRKNPFLDARGRVRRNDGRFAMAPYSHPRDWMTTEHGRIPWLPGVRSNPSGWNDHDLDIIFANPTRKPAKRKAAKKPAKRKAAKKPAKRKAAKKPKQLGPGSTATAPFHYMRMPGSEHRPSFSRPAVHGTGHFFFGGSEPVRAPLPAYRETAPRSHRLTTANPTSRRRKARKTRRTRR